MGVGLGRRHERRRQERRSLRGRAPRRTTLRDRFSQWGGLWLVIPAGGFLIVFIVAAWINRPGSSMRTDPFMPAIRSVVDGRVEGDPNAPIEIVEYADFACSSCREFEMKTRAFLLREYVQTGLASIEFRHVATRGPESIRAGEAAECALDQGSFWEMHDLLFLRQGDLNSGVFSDKNLKEFARELARFRPHLDTERFDRCLDSESKHAVVTDMTEDAQGSGVQSTPTFRVNDEVLIGAMSIEGFRSVIARHLERRTDGEVGNDLDLRLRSHQSGRGP